MLSSDIKKARRKHTMTVNLATDHTPAASLFWVLPIAMRDLKTKESLIMRLAMMGLAEYGRQLAGRGTRLK